MVHRRRTLRLLPRAVVAAASRVNQCFKVRNINPTRERGRQDRNFRDRPRLSRLCKCWRISPGRQCENAEGVEQVSPGQRPEVTRRQHIKALQGRDNRRRSRYVDHGSGVAPTGLNRLLAVPESRALPWPNMFDAFGVAEIAAESAALAIIAGTCIMLLLVGLVGRGSDGNFPKMKQCAPLAHPPSPLTVEGRSRR